jgi:hypothetical protein
MNPSAALRPRTGSSSRSAILLTLQEKRGSEQPNPVIVEYACSLIDGEADEILRNEVNLDHGDRRANRQEVLPPLQELGRDLATADVYPRVTLSPISLLVIGIRGRE